MFGALSGAVFRVAHHAHDQVHQTKYRASAWAIKRHRTVRDLDDAITARAITNALQTRLRSPRVQTQQRGSVDGASMVP